MRRVETRKKASGDSEFRSMDFYVHNEVSDNPQNKRFAIELELATWKNHKPGVAVYDTSPIRTGRNCRDEDKK
jgi:hypothetical protein